MMMIFFLSSSCRFVEVWRRERDDQISKLLLPFSSIYEQRARIRATLIKRLCIHYSLVLVRIWWWYWWWWKWSEWIDRSREVQEAAGERRKRNFLLFSFFFHLFWKRRFVWSSTDRHRVQRKRGGVFLSQSFSLFLFFSFSLSPRSWITTRTHHINSLFLIIIIK